jgi:hypothetical protein
MSTLGATLLSGPAGLPVAAPGRAGPPAPSTPSTRRTLARLGRSALAAPARPARVAAMLFAIIAMSLADLYMTLTHLLHFGMIEANPLARRIMETGSPVEIIIWKLTTVLVAVGILFAFRRRRAAEFGALACLLVMTWLTAHWFNYNDAVSLATADMHALAALQEPGFVTMAPAGRGD